jgi:S-formylglutathione hydrolase FrmB
MLIMVALTRMTLSSPRGEVIQRMRAGGRGRIDSDSDPFVEKKLRPELLEAPCAPAGIALSLRHQPGYDHSYYFISKFMPDHVVWRAERLRGG